MMAMQSSLATKTVHFMLPEEGNPGFKFAQVARRSSRGINTVMISVGLVGVARPSRNTR